jgi:Uma2 family endonuclease
MAVQQRLYTVDDLREMDGVTENADKRFELIRGVIFEMPAPSPIHAYIANKFGRYLDEFVEEHDLGYVFGDSCSYQLSDIDELIPDASFISKARQPSLPLPEAFEIAPDLAIEVVSPSNRPREMLNKVETYLKYGTRQVWVVYPDEKIVDVYRSADDDGLLVQSVGIDDALDGDELLPGFSLAVRRVFPPAE